MKSKKRVAIPKAVHKIRTIGKSRLGIINVDNSFRVFDLVQLKLAGGFKTVLPKNSETISNTDVTPNGMFVTLFDQKSKKQLVYYTKTKKSVYSLSEHQGPVESVCFSPNSMYLATGGQDGKTYLWSMKNGKIVGTLPPHADYVTTIAFSDNGHWVASGSYDKQVNVTNISSMHQKFKLRGHKAAVKQLLFISKQRLISADKGGDLIVWDYMKEKVITRLTRMLDEVTAMAVSTNGKFLFVTDKTRRVTLYNLDTYEVMSDELFKLKNECRAIEYSNYNNMLTFGLTSGEVIFFDILADEEAMMDDIEEKAYEAAYRKVDSNPILQYTSAYELLEQEWEFNLELAQSLLQEGKQKEAKEILKPFQVSPQKRLFTQKVLKDFVAFEKFKTAAVAKKYPLAYSLSSQYPALEETKYYKAMEAQWKQTLAQVKKIIATKGGDEKANELFKPFKGISSKAKIIQSIFEERQIIALFQKKISEHNYKDAMLLVRKHPFLTNFEDYDKLLDLSHKLEKQAKSLLQQGKYAQVISVCEKLEGYPDKKEIALKLTKEANAYAQAMKYYADKNFSALYKMVEEYPFLEDAEMIIKMERSWQKRVFEGELIASKGDIESIQSMFKNFLKIEAKIPKIANLLKIAYINQIKKEVRNEAVSTQEIKGAIERYIYYFGIEDLIADLIDKIKKYRKKFNINLDMILQEGDDFSWVKKELPLNIFEKSS